MMGELLDPVKKFLGNVSVVRGWEPEVFAKDKDEQRRHSWMTGREKRHSVLFVTPVNPDPGYLELLQNDCRVMDVIQDEFPDEGHLVRVDIQDFDPSASHSFTSASDTEFPWETEV